MSRLNIHRYETSRRHGAGAMKQAREERRATDKKMRSRWPNYHTEVATTCSLDRWAGISLDTQIRSHALYGGFTGHFGLDLMCAVSRNKKLRAGVSTDGKRLAGLGLARACFVYLHIYFYFVQQK